MMKLNGISIDSFGVCKSLNLDNLSHDMSLLFGKNGSGKTTVARFIRNTLFGYQLNEKEHGRGYLDASDQSVSSFRLYRNENSAHLLKNEFDPVALPEAIGGMRPEIFDSVFQIDGRQLAKQIDEIVRVLMVHLNVPQGRNGVENSTWVAERANSAKLINSKIARLESHITQLELEKASLENRLREESRSNDLRRNDIEVEIQKLAQRLSQLDLAPLRNEIEVLDREIANLRIQIETSSDRIEYVSRPFRQSDGLAILYHRLDEIDDQLRRWRNVHKDIQQQRVVLKDDMISWNGLTLESTGHPYFRSRELLNQIESKLDSAEESMVRYHNHKSNAIESKQVFEAMTHLCGQIRSDLYQLCDELGAQYKNIRHKNAASELKRMRRCYHEIGENIETLLEARQNIIQEIRHIDPAGAAAIARAEHGFCECAHHEGYLQARRRFVGEITSIESTREIVRSDVSEESDRLRHLELERSLKVKQLVQFENEKTELDSQYHLLQIELERNVSVRDLETLTARLTQVGNELNKSLDERAALESELERIEKYSMPVPNRYLTRAAVLISELTRQEIADVWVTDQTVEVSNHAGKVIAYSSLSSGIQQQVALGLCLAAVEEFNRLQVVLPMILDDVFVNLDQDLIHATFSCLQDISSRGIQIIALTSDQTAYDLARGTMVTVLDLPDTSVSPANPLWAPNIPDYPIRREPGFSTLSGSYTLRKPDVNFDFTIDNNIDDSALKYPVTGATTHVGVSKSEASMPETKHIYRTVVAAEVPVEVEIEGPKYLDALKIMDSSESHRLGLIGVQTIDQLLECDPSDMPRDKAELIEFWQAIIWMMKCVPSLSAEEAKILIAIGITEPEQLENTSSQQLLERMNRYLVQTEGNGSTDISRYQVNRERIHRWYDSLNQTRSEWRLASGYSRRNRWRKSFNKSSHRNDLRRDFDQMEISKRLRPEDEPVSRRRRTREDVTNPATLRMLNRNESVRKRRQTSSGLDTVSTNNSNHSSANQKSVAAELKFYLDVSDHLEAAPAIGVKTAERFAKINVETVKEFLTQTAESMAEKINYKRITADLIRQWQHQARLVCRVPNLRGHDAQLLVACGIIEAEDLASQSANRLWDVVRPFAESKDGLKIIRGGKQPDLEEINDWIQWAQHTRSLQAA
ncbi:MAG: DUF4332 domain-containing protein [Planctomycetota bacterium]